MRTWILHARSVSNISQPKSSFEEAYNKTLEQMETLKIDRAKLSRDKGLVTLLITGDPLENISSANLIIECGGFNFTVNCERC